MITSKFWKNVLLSFLILMAFGLIISPMAFSQYNWIPLPPYNFLWPLWSPALSPPDPLTGLPTPIVDQLTHDIELPKEPGLVWNPSLDYPWLLYNTPVGLAYYDPLYGVNLWPPPNFIDPVGNPIPISITDDDQKLPPTDPSWLQQNVLFANSYFVQVFTSLLKSAGLNPKKIKDGPNLLDFLPPAAILGLSI